MFKIVLSRIVLNFEPEDNQCCFFYNCLPPQVPILSYNHHGRSLHNYSFHKMTSLSALPYTNTYLT